MRELVPFQAADLIAYEFHKECDRRRFRSNDEPRPGYVTLSKMSNRLGFPQPLLHFQEKKDLVAHEENALAEAGILEEKESREKMKMIRQEYYYPRQVSKDLCFPPQSQPSWAEPEREKHVYVPSV